MANVEFNEADVVDYHTNNFPGNGKLETVSKTSVKTARDLTLAYSPGVAVACLQIKANPDLLRSYTNIGNTVAVISNGSRVLGLGNIGLAGYPVMEGKSILFKALANVDSVPFILDTTNVDDFIKIVEAMSQNFGGINLEDIQKPDCFEIERTLDKRLPIPVFHDDQWGTAIVSLAGTINAFKLTDKKFSDAKVVINGAGASGLAISTMLLDRGIQGKNMHILDREGTLYSGRGKRMDRYKEELASRINPQREAFDLTDAVEGADLLIGVSQSGAFKSDHICRMADKPIVFALANPDPEILPKEAAKADVHIIATGRSDYNNQINNVLGFPGIFRGALDVKATSITPNMKIAAADAIASVLPLDELNINNIITSPVDKRLMPSEAAAVAKAAVADGVAQIKLSYDEVFELTKKRIDYVNAVTESTNKIRMDYSQ